MQKLFRIVIRNITVFSKSTIAILVLLLLFCGIRFGGMYGYYINGDGKGYYAYLPATIIYHDFKFDFFKPLEKKYYPPNTGVDFLSSQGEGKFVNKYYAGTALLMLPFFLLAHLLSLLIGWPADGFAPAYQYSVLLSAIFYLMLGMYYLRKLLLAFGFAEVKSSLITGLMVFATPVIFYTLYNPEYSHIYSFSLITIFLFYSKKYIEGRGAGYLILISVLLAIITLVRPVNGIVVLSLPFMATNGKQFFQRVLDTLKQFKILVLSLSLFFLIISIQLVYYKLQTGHWFIWSYSNESFNFKESHFFDALISYKKGFFVYTPLAFLSLFGYIRLFSKNIYRAICLLAFMSVAVFLISSWHCWWYGMCFSYRPLTEYVSFFAILLGFAFELKVNRYLKLFFSIALIFTLFLNFIQIHQYTHYILHWDNMNKERYWKVFMRTSDEYRWLLWRDTPALTDKYPAGAYHDTLFQSKAYILNDSSSDAPGLAAPLKKISNQVTDTTFFFISARIKPLTQPKGTLTWVLSLQKGNNISYCKTFELDLLPLYKNHWYTISKLIKLPKPQNSEETLKLYLRNTSPGKISVDSMVIEMISFK